MDLARGIEPIPGFAEPVSSLTHLIGAGVFAVLGAWLLYRASPHNRPWLTLFVFGAVFSLAMSGVYHMFPIGEFVRHQVLRRLDHAAIFVLIAGSLTAAHGILFAGFWRWGAVVTLWLLAASAISLQMVFFNGIPEAVSLVLYLAFGWFGLIAGIKLWCRFGFHFIRFALWGGLAYTIGGVVDYGPRPLWIPGVFGAHEFFHMAVLVGLACHWRFFWCTREWGLTNGATEQPAPEESL